MRTVTRPDDDPFNIEYWQWLGATEGSRNEPRKPDGPASVRTLLDAVWQGTLRVERQDFLDALEGLHQRRADNQRLILEVEAGANRDPRQAAVLKALQAKALGFADERARLCDAFLEAVEALTHQVRAADAVWRAANELHRDRRITLEPTEFTVPPDVVVIPPDPVA
ncbi:hypothetical protein [Granulicoccus sp. GXG6511]|uniref:hypothetical protein n=1 Tax=Granulicoccus sp. GXG6511 TaxID=3381351 RepID=UPI003D7ED103